MTRARDVANLIGSGNYSSTTFTATAGQTAFTISHTQGFVQVFMNGLLLDETVDYTSNGTAITLTSGAAAGDEIEVVAYNTFSVGDALPKSGGTFTGAVTHNSTVTHNNTVTHSGDVTITGDANDANGNLKVTTNTPSNYPAMVVQTSTGGNSTETHGLHVNNDANGYGIKIDAGNGNQLVLNNGGERFTQLTYMNNNTQAAAMWYDGTNNKLVNHVTSGNGFNVELQGAGETLSISSTGAVNTPYQPYAIVKFASGDDGAYNQSGSANRVIKPSAVWSNNGNHYSTSTGLFTCPIAGVYTVQCSGNVYNNSAGSYLRPTIQKNGSAYLYHYENTQMTWHNYHFTAPVVCAANDTLGVLNQTQSGVGGGFDINDYSMLSFFLIA